MRPTPYDDLNQIAAAVLERLHAVLGTNLGGLYLFGSAAVGAFETGVSDVDVLSVTIDALSDAEFGSLSAMHDALARDYPAWDDRIETKYLSAAGLRAFRSVPARMAAISPGEPFAWEEAGPGRVMVWYDVQENGITLFGPAPSAFIPQISEAEFVDCVRKHLNEWPQWLEELPRRTGSQSYAVLTMCRAIYACRSGKQLSKRQAGLWVQQQLPQWTDLIQTALDWRLNSSGPVQRDAGERELASVKAFVAFAGRATAVPGAIVCGEGGG
ncbi:MAG: aminoglycoside adenylyltransferase domain-containing protein [Anaerolineaceae bacterium]